MTFTEMVDSPATIKITITGAGIVGLEVNVGHDVEGVLVGQYEDVRNNVIECCHEHNIRRVLGNMEKELK